VPIPQALIDRLIADIDLPDDIMYLQSDGETVLYRQKAPDDQGDVAKEPVEVVGKLSDSGDGLLCNIYDKEIYKIFAILEKKAKRRYGTRLTVRLVEPEPADD
jgi:hypothetical protein